MARNRVIAHGGVIPWQLPEDFRWVKRKTTGQVIVMGRKTFESLGKPLPGRTNVVLSRSLKSAPDGVVLLPDLEALTAWAPGAPGETWIFGGADIYRQTLPLCSDLYLSVVDCEPEGDRFFPPFEAEFELHETVRTYPAFKILHYRRSHRMGG